MKRILIVALCLIPADGLRAAPSGDPHAELASEMYELDPEVRRTTLEVLRRKNAHYEQDALDNLAKKGEVFTYARVEVTGVMSSDDTAEYDEFLFEKYIKPSFSVRESGLRGLLGGPINEVLKKLFPPVKTGEIIRDASLDIQEFAAAAAGEMTDRAREKLAPYRGAEINELVAHSWGTELIYAAILNGEIRPPKRLIVVGVPDNDRSKWDMLAARTGTEVIWARADNDAVVLDAGMQLALRAAAKVDFKAKWDSLCANRATKSNCHAHGRTSKPVVRVNVGRLPGVTGHARTEYYDLLKKKKYLNGPASELRNIEVSNIEAEIMRVRGKSLAEAQQEAHGIVEQARAQAKIAEREHDERLKMTYADMAIRSCSNPGSVAQAELDALPVPYQKNLLTATAIPWGFDDCSVRVYMNLRRGADAEEIRRLATPVALAVQPPPEPQLARQPSPSPQPIQATIPFNSTFPRLADLAAAACASPSRASLGSQPLRQSSPDSFSRDRDDVVAARLAVGLGECPRKLFYELIETIRSGQAASVNDRWLQDKAARFTPPAYYAPPPRSSPPTGCIPGDNSRRNCIACGNKNCG
ncbi:MAG: hypothetical protein Q8T11_02605 [Elusimicrobiota bacterium]|nr:hypothetical protein [Elusimicrobiota bacterium]